MIDLHTHTILSDGCLIASELARRAEVAGYTAIAITDHVDMSNIDFIVPRIVNTSKVLSKHWKIKVVPGCELTHVPVEIISSMVKLARKLGAKVVIGHGETITEPVLKSTNLAFIKAKVDVLAHPGSLTEDAAMLAKKNKVLIELTSRKGHNKGNRAVLKMVRKYKLKIVLNNDAHMPEDLLNKKERHKFYKALGLSAGEMEQAELNAVKLIKF